MSIGHDNSVRCQDDDKSGQSSADLKNKKQLPSSQPLFEPPRWQGAETEQKAGKHIHPPQCVQPHSELLLERDHNGRKDEHTGMDGKVGDPCEAQDNF